MIATGVRPRPLPGAEFDGKTIISYKEAMTLPKQPKSMLIIGGGPIGLEFGYFYNAIGTKVTLVELLDRILPGEDEEVSKALQPEPDQARADDPHQVEDRQGREDRRRGQGGGRDAQGPKTVEAEMMLVSIGVLGNVEGLFADNVKVEIVKNHIKADPKNGYVTSVPGIYAVGDVIGPPWLAHVAHHEAICCIERLCGHADRTVDYTTIPGCTYTDPGRRQRRPDREGRARGGPRGPHRQVPVPSAAGPWPRTRPRASSSSSSTPSTASSWAPTCSARRPPS